MIIRKINTALGLKTGKKVREPEVTPYDSIAAMLADPAVDYGALFSYLGKTKTATEMYKGLYITGETVKPWEAQGDRASITDIQVEEGIRLEVYNRMGFTDRLDPVTQEKYLLAKRLMTETMKYTRQLLGSIAGAQ